MTQKIGRNDPCPCGSGLKYKHCHGGPRQEPRAAAEVEARDSAVPRALGWLAERHRKAMQAALDELLFEQLWPEDGPDPNEIDESMHDMLTVNLLELLLAEGAIQIKGHWRNVNGYVLGENGPAFSPDERRWIEQLGRQPLLLYTVIDVRRGAGLTLVDELDEQTEPLRVEERLGSESLRSGMLLGCRVMVDGNRRVLSGAIYPFSPLAVGGALAQVRAEIAAPRSAETLPSAMGLAIARAWLRQLLLPPMPTMVDAVSGDPLLLVTDHYRVLDADVLARALAACSEVTGNSEEGWSREREFEDGLMRSLVAINRGRQSDRIEVFYRTQRLADDGRAWFEGVAGDAVRHLTREIVDPRGALRDAEPRPAAPTPVGDGLPPEVLAEAIEQVLLRSYANWADEPIPALGDKTPREAVGTPAGLRRVKGLLRSYEDGEEDMARMQRRRPISYQFLWDALGIAR